MENPNFKIGETALGESDTDSGVCGKRKRGEIQEIEKIDSGGEIAKIDSGGCGGEIAKIDSGGCGGEIAKIDPGGGSAMAEEKKTRHVTKFEDRYGLFRVFEGKMSFEDEAYDPLRRDNGSSSDDEGDSYMVQMIKEQPYDREEMLKYISQVRNSFGLDVDVRIPCWLLSYLLFLPLEVSHPLNHDYVYSAGRVAVDEINADMKSKTYELVEVAKAVSARSPRFMLFLTLVVKNVEEEEAATVTIRAIVRQLIPPSFELHQWMVKPEPEP